MPATPLVSPHPLCSSGFAATMFMWLFVFTAIDFNTVEHLPHPLTHSGWVRCHPLIHSLTHAWHAPLVHLSVVEPSSFTNPLQFGVELGLHIASSQRRPVPVPGCPTSLSAKLSHAPWQEYPAGFTVLSFLGGLVGTADYFMEGVTDQGLGQGGTSQSISCKCHEFWFVGVWVDYFMKPIPVSDPCIVSVLILYSFTKRSLWTHILVPVASQTGIHSGHCCSMIQKRMLHTGVQMQRKWPKGARAFVRGGFLFDE